MLLWSLVEPAAERSAGFARDFYDTERERLGLPYHPIPLRVLDFDKFRSDMEPAFRGISLEESSDGAVSKAALRVARSIENSGRWTIIRASEVEDPGLDELAGSEEGDDEYSLWVDSDEDDDGDSEDEKSEPDRKRGGTPRLIKGWARVATGRETCGWCLMLVSRGPVYKSAETAGARVSDRDAVQLSGSGEISADEHMRAWHAGCDCKVVPVFRLDDWSGRDSYLAARRLWYSSTKGFSGRDAVNAFRRAVESGGYQDELAAKAA